MGVQVVRSGEVRVQHPFQEGEGPGAPGGPGQVGELLRGECRHHDPATVRGSEVAGEPAVMRPGWMKLGQEGELASEGVSEVFCRPQSRRVTGHEAHRR
jgi:hypothetical protein